VDEPYRSIVLRRFFMAFACERVPMRCPHAASLLVVA